MLKYVNTGVVFQEIPDEVTLSINISNCPCHCIGCHSEYLWQDIGNPLTTIVLDKFIEDYGDDITCVCFMGGDSDVKTLVYLAEYLHTMRKEIKIGWYTGRHTLPSDIDKNVFDYIKIGPYIENLGGLKSNTTNQRMLMKVSDDNYIDITSRFWKK